MANSPEQFNTYSKKEAQNEASKMQGKIVAGQAKDYSEAEGQIEAEKKVERAALQDKEKNRKTPSDFFKEDPNIEHGLCKIGDDDPVDVTLRSFHDGLGHTFVSDKRKIHDLYISGGEKPYISIHNHSIDIEKGGNSLPSFQDLYSFLIDDEIGIKEIYQHNSATNETEGVFKIKKTEKTPKSGIGLSEITKDFERDKDAENEIERKRPGLRFSFDKKYTFTGPIHDYFMLQNNPHSYFNAFNKDIPEDKMAAERQRLIQEIAKKMHLEIEYVPAKGHQYFSGVGFIKSKGGENNQSNKS